MGIVCMRVGSVGLGVRMVMLVSIVYVCNVAVTVEHAHWSISVHLVLLPCTYTKAYAQTPAQQNTTNQQQPANNAHTNAHNA